VWGNIESNRIYQLPDFLEKYARYADLHKTASRKSA
jgi:hypothetical protein